MTIDNDPMPSAIDFVDDARRQLWARWATRVLIVYWVLLFISTHVTIPGPVKEAADHDKLMHLVAYGGLGFLCAVVWSLRSRLTCKAALSIWIGLLVYGAVDEVLQMFVDREASLLDWAADALGAVGGIALAGWVIRQHWGRSP